MIQEINLSYVLTTFNKFPYLKIVLDDLIKNCQPDEEIVVIDGVSNDGTTEYLQNLFDQNKIQQFLSESDKGESHGFNKGILMAKGKLIKLLSDDDIFSYTAIKECKDFMLKNSPVELINTNGGWAKSTDLSINEFTTIYQDFFVNKWLTEKHPFAHCCLGLMLRKTSLPKIGLLGVGFARADAEYSLRYTSIPINIYWYTGITYVRLLNESSNSVKYSSKISAETKNLNLFYGFDIDNIFFDKKEKQNISAFNFLKKVIKRIVYGFRKHSNKVDSFIEETKEDYDFNVLHDNAIYWMKNVNMRQNKFIGNEKND